MKDESNGYEAIALDYIAVRSGSIGTQPVREWAGTLPAGTCILDIGCGHGLPIARALAEDGFRLCGVDASPTLLEAYVGNVPGALTECARAEESGMFGRSFDGIMAWGLLFLLDPADQETVIRRVGAALNPLGTFLFTAPAEEAEWTDTLTRRKSISLGASRYESLLAEYGMALASRFEDEGGNHYYIARRRGSR